MIKVGDVKNGRGVRENIKMKVMEREAAMRCRNWQVDEWEGR